MVCRMSRADVTIPGSGVSRAAWLTAAFVIVGIAITVGVWRWVSGSGDAAGSAHFGRSAPPVGNVLRFVNGPEPETIDPGLMSGQPDGRIARAIFEGLVTPDPRTLEPIEGVASRWERADDGVTYTFHLRTDAVWTNGDRVSAHDFAWSWMRVLHPDTPARYADLFYLIRNARAYKAGEIDDPAAVGIRALDAQTFEVVLETPTPYFLQLVTFYPFLPVHRASVERYGDAWTHPEHIVTNGPFRLAMHRQNDRFHLEKFQEYWDAANVRLDGIVAYSLDDLSTMLNMYRAGMTDWNPSGYLPAEYIPYVQHYEDYRAGPFLGSYFYSMVVTRPPFDDKRVRQALGFAINREQITSFVLHNSVSAWGRIVPDGFAEYPYPDPVRFDPEKARQLLAEAGYPGGDGFPTIEILFNTSEDHKKIAEAIQAMWKQHLGIDVKLLNQEWASYMRTTIDREYQVARRTWIGDYVDPNTFLAILRGGEGNNRTNWSNARYDELVAAAADELDAERRMRLLAQAEAIALDEMPFIPIYSYRTREFVAPYVRGWYPTALDAHPLKYIWFDREPSEPDMRGARR
jgi:oligopeptide transport system substrate-binding protein